MRSETLLMIDLTEAEEKLIKRLMRPFEIKAVSIKDFVPGKHFDLFHEKKICLVIVHLNQDYVKPINSPPSLLKSERGVMHREVKKIRHIKQGLALPVPMLLMIPDALPSRIDAYMKAGADDYVVMPLNEDSFVMRFYVLLECGQAILRTRQINEPNKDAWQLIRGYFQEGISFFAPKSQLAIRGRQPISNKWLPLRKLATGSDAVIWIVREQGKERQAVAKIPHSTSLNINSLRGAAVLKRLVYHPNVVHLMEVVKDDGKFILIQEYIDGLTLSDLMATNLSARKKEALFLQLLSVVAYAHGHGIMHRDIKPDNIMVRTKDGRLKLLDFGSAKEMDWVDPPGPPQGTLNFMPPEQLEGNTCLASDVWALGVILYLLSVNRLPLYQDNSFYPMDIETDMAVVPPHKIRPDFPVNLEQVIMTCLQKNLEKRYENALILRDELLNKIPNFGNGIHIPQW